MALASSVTDLLAPRIQKVALDFGIPGLTIEKDFAGIRLRSGRHVADITYDQMAGHFRAETYGQLDADVLAACRYLKSVTSEIGVLRRRFRTKQRNILARKA
jgi:hypothetical protein